MTLLHMTFALLQKIFLQAFYVIRVHGGEKGKHPWQKYLWPPLRKILENVVKEKIKNPDYFFVSFLTPTPPMVDRPLDMYDPSAQWNESHLSGRIKKWSPRKLPAANFFSRRFRKIVKEVLRIGKRHFGTCGKKMKQ